MGRCRRDTRAVAPHEMMQQALELPSPLRPYQRDGVQFLVERKHALLADQMGLGKTVQVAVALLLLARKSLARRTLVVCPASLRVNWERELNHWTPDLVSRRVRGSREDRNAYYRMPIQVLIASYEQVRLDAQTMPPQVTFDVVVLDEAQRIKNIDAQTNLACRLLNRRRSWALTGTPLENSPDDLFAIFRFVSPALLERGMSRQLIHENIQGYFLRRRKSQVAQELPPINVQELQVELANEQRQAYRRMWRTRNEWVDRADGVTDYANLLGIITKLKQLCNYDPASQQSAKLDALQSVLDDVRHSREKVLLFSQYVETLRWLAERLGVPYELYHGGMDDREKSRSIQRFKESSCGSVLLVSLRAGGTGLNLQEADTVVLFDRWWNPAVEQQAIERAHRLGRDRPLHVIKFITVDTIEERINEVLLEKKELFDEYVEAAPGADTQAFSGSDLKRLLAL